MHGPWPAASRAFRRELLGAVLGFLLFFVVALTLLIWLSAERFTEEGWWALGTLVRWLPVALIVGILGALAVQAPLAWLHHRMGVYRCWQCGRPIRRGGGPPCPCLGAKMTALWVKVHRRRPSRLWRHHVPRRIVPVLLAYLAIVPIAVLATAIRPSAFMGSVAADLVISHAIACVGVGVVLRLATVMLELLGRGRRWRLRAAVFLMVFAIWPLCVVLAMILVTAVIFAP